MNAYDFAAKLRACRREIAAFTPDSLSRFFDLPKRNFNQSGPGEPIVYHPGVEAGAESMLLRGTIFCNSDADRRIIRGHPRLSLTSDYCSDRRQILIEMMLAAAAGGAGEVIAEPKLYGGTVRVFRHAGELYCATDVAHDGGNPIVAAGIDNALALGIDYGSQAARILSERYTRVERLAGLGYVAVFVLQLPEISPDHGLDRSDMVLVDVIDPDYLFVDRLEKERIAEDFALNVVAPAMRISIESPDPAVFVRRLRALEHQPSKPGSCGFIVKGRSADSDEQLFCRVEPGPERDHIRGIADSDIAAVTDEITGQFGDEVWRDERFSEELILEYLGSHHRSARWRVIEYLSAWRNARKLAGLA